MARSPIGILPHPQPPEGGFDLSRKRERGKHPGEISRAPKKKSPESQGELSGPVETDLGRDRFPGGALREVSEPRAPLRAPDD